jgi:NADPH:quinone reductase-like Zn-dependent oxidoreductase
VAETTVVQYSRIGGPEVLEFATLPLAQPAAGEVVVEVLAIGVNPIDGKLRSGVRKTAPITEPRRVGSDASGVIVAIGDGVEEWAVGDEVIVGTSGAYATFLLVSVDRLDRKPDEWSFEQAAAVGVPVATAYQTLKSLGVTAGDTLLLHGGSGAVGQAVIQFAVAWGVTVVATSGPARQGRVLGLGAIPVEYGDGLVERVREAAPQGIDYVLDAAGTDEALEASFALVSDRWRIGTIVVGARAAELGIRAWSGGNPLPLSDDELRLRREGVSVASGLAADGRFDVEVAQTLPFDEVAEAHRLVDSGEATGKVVLLP